MSLFGPSQGRISRECGSMVVTVSLDAAAVLLTQSAAQTQPTLTLVTSGDATANFEYATSGRLASDATRTVVALALTDACVLHAGNGTLELVVSGSFHPIDND
jgi:hypothetical protein